MLISHLKGHLPALSGFLIVLSWTVPASAIDGAGIRPFTVESDPPGAEVITITGHQGTTPVTLDERDIYPNSYPSEKMSQYGVVTLRKTGCRELNIRPGDSDIVNGLSLQMDCNQATEASSPEPQIADDGADRRAADLGETRAASHEADTPASKRLEQLRFLQDLLDEGLITSEEEATIRRRILEQR